MRYILFLLAVITLLASTGCIFPGDRGDRGRGEGRGHWERGDRDEDRGDRR
ncbi:MAG: hypothetical protein ACYDH9_06100 [Limisphaerales bacterium]